jgi:hypothetical protein
MKTNTPFVTLKDSGVNPLTSANTDLVTAFATCGGDIMEQGYKCSELTEKGKDPTVSVQWHLKSMVLNFPIADNAGKTSMTTSDFIARWNDHEWLKANSDHPLTFIKYFVLTRGKYRDKIRQLGSQIHMRRGDRNLYLDRNLSEEKKRKLLQLFNSPKKI